MFEAKENYFTLDGKPVYVYSGEIHYFRIDPSLWSKHLERAKEAGLNTVSTYIPWSWHEYEEGKFDFEGKTHPQRNLSGYLEEVRKAGLLHSVRIGPFSNAELKGEGLPKWLLDEHDEIYSSGEGIQNLPHTTIVSYIHPVFREYVRKWYDRVIPEIAPLQISSGGNIALVQLCNEIGMIHWVNGHGDYSEPSTKMYQDYLKNKYSSIKELVKVYPGSSFKDFSEIKHIPLRQSYGWQDLWDWADYFRNYFADYYEYLFKLARERGVTTPVIANIPQFIDFDVRGRGFASPMTTSFYRYIPDKVENVVYGGAYQMRRMDYENFHDVMITTQVVKSLTDYSNPVLCAELQTGIMRDKPRLYPSDVELNLKTSMASGVNGVNCYMFSGGANPDNIGMFGTRHEWQAPVASDCTKRAHFSVLKEHGNLVKTFGREIAETEPVFQTALGLYNPYYATEFLKYDDCSWLIYARDRYFFDGIGRLLNLGNINFKIVDLLKKELDPSEFEHLWVFSLSLMDEDTQKKLADYAEKGGKLVLFPELPENDLAGNKCTVLTDRLGITPAEKVSSSHVYLNGEKESFMEGVSTIVDVKGDFKELARVENKICAVSKQVGGGKFVFLGMPFAHYYDYQINMIKDIAKEELGIKENVKINPYDVVGFLRWSSEHGFLFLMNYHQQDFTVDADIDIPEKGIKQTHKAIAVPSRTAKVIPVNVKISDDVKIKFSTAQINAYAINGDEIELDLKGARGAEETVTVENRGEEKVFSHVLKDELERVKFRL